MAAGGQEEQEQPAVWGGSLPGKEPKSRTTLCTYGARIRAHFSSQKWLLRWQIDIATIQKIQNRILRKTCILEEIASKTSSSSGDDALTDARETGE